MNTSNAPEEPLAQKPPFYWKPCLVWMLLSPLIGFGVGLTFFHVTMPKLNVSVTAPSILGEASIRGMYEYKLAQAKVPYAWKIHFWGWVTILAIIVASLVWVQYSIMKRRRELAAAKGDTSEFDRLVAPQEPYQWLLAVWRFLQALPTANGQQRLSQFIADFFVFKLLLINILAPLLFGLGFLFLCERFLSQISDAVVLKGGSSVAAIFVTSILQFLSFRIGLEILLVPFSIQGILRYIRRWFQIDGNLNY